MDTTEKDKYVLEENHILNFLSSKEPNTKEYRDAVEALKILCEAQSKHKRFIIEPEVILTASLTLLEIVLIIRHEEFNVIVSKALSFVRLSR